MTRGMTRVGDGQPIPKIGSSFLFYNWLPLPPDTTQTRKQPNTSVNACIWCFVSWLATAFPWNGGASVWWPRKTVFASPSVARNARRRSRHPPPPLPSLGSSAGGPQLRQQGGGWAGSFQKLYIQVFYPNFYLFITRGLQDREQRRLTTPAATPINASAGMQLAGGCSDLQGPGKVWVICKYGK
jgi:hypothetical protein